MISDAEIQSWADDLTEEEPLKHALLELLTHRKSWSEPVAFTSERSLEVRDKITAFTSIESAETYGASVSWAMITPLFRKPFTE